MNFIRVRSVFVSKTAILKFFDFEIIINLKPSLFLPDIKNATTMTTTASKVVNAIAETYRTTISFEEKVNNFLDNLISVRDDMQKVNEEWKNVNELAQIFISECHSKNELTVVLLTLSTFVTTFDGVFQKLEKAGLKKVLPSVMLDFEDNLDHIKEIQADVKIKISENAELANIESKLYQLGF